jgi:hypothetical protein
MTKEITEHDIEWFYEINETLAFMGHEFLMELRHCIPPTDDILGIPKIDAIVDNVVVTKNKHILVTIYDITNNRNRVCFTLDAKNFLKDRKKCAEDCYNEWFLEEKQRRFDMTKEKELKEYNRIKTKYNL